MDKAREFQKNISFSFIDYRKAFGCVHHNKLRNLLNEMGLSDHLISLEICMQVETSGSWPCLHPAAWPGASRTTFLDDIFCISGDTGSLYYLYSNKTTCESVWSSGSILNCPLGIFQFQKFLIICLLPVIGKVNIMGEWYLEFRRLQAGHVGTRRNAVHLKYRSWILMSSVTESCLTLRSHEL